VHCFQIGHFRAGCKIFFCDAFFLVLSPHPSLVMFPPLRRYSSSFPLKGRAKVHLPSDCRSSLNPSPSKNFAVFSQALSSMNNPLPPCCLVIEISFVPSHPLPLQGNSPTLASFRLPDLAGRMFLLKDFAPFSPPRTFSRHGPPFSWLNGSVFLLPYWLRISVTLLHLVSMHVGIGKGLVPPAFSPPVEVLSSPTKSPHVFVRQDCPLVMILFLKFYTPPLPSKSFLPCFCFHLRFLFSLTTPQRRDFLMGRPWDPFKICIGVVTP